MNSKSSKIKQKGLRIIKCLSSIVTSNIHKIKIADLFYVKVIISLLKEFLGHQIESKFHYQTVLNIGIILN